MVFIVYQNPNTNSMEICVPAISGAGEQATDIQEVIKKDIPKDNNGNTLPYNVFETLPLKYLDSYDFNNDYNNIIQNRTKLHNLKKQEWRNKRFPLLQKLDVDFLKALETNDIVKVEEIKIKKQQLRDITDIDVSYLTNQQLEEFTPDILL